MEPALFFTVGILYLALFIVLGVTCFRKRRIVMFVLGFFFPLLWALGAVLPERG